MKQITSLFVVQVLRRQSGVYFLNIPQGGGEWYSTQRKGIKEENPKKYLHL